MKQNNEYYHNSTISSIRDNLLELSSKVNSVKIIYIPAYKGYTDNETADELAKIALLLLSLYLLLTKLQMLFK